MKPLLIGEAPGPNGDPEKPLEGKPAERLLESMGYWARSVSEIPEAGTTLREIFEVRNLIDRPMERTEGSKGTDWPEDEARDAAHRLAHLVEPNQPVVFLGKRVATAFELPVVEWWKWTRQWAGRKPSPWALLQYAIIPHPSGIVRTWNQPVNRVRAGMVLWQALGEIPR